MGASSRWRGGVRGGEGGREGGREGLACLPALRAANPVPALALSTHHPVTAARPSPHPRPIPPSESVFNMLESCVAELAEAGVDRGPSGSTISGAGVGGLLARWLGGCFIFTSYGCPTFCDDMRTCLPQTTRSAHICMSAWCCARVLCAMCSLTRARAHARTYCCCRRRRWRSRMCSRCYACCCCSRRCPPRSSPSRFRPCSGVVPSGTFRTADSRYVVIGGNGDSVYSRLMAAVGRPDMAADNPK